MASLISALAVAFFTGAWLGWWAHLDPLDPAPIRSRWEHRDTRPFDQDIDL